jgi:ubiquinone/menaquinone biosynthesis C-methylase UbiE
VKAYYDARAPEYDDVWLGQGRFAGRHGTDWFEEVVRLQGLVASLPAATTLDVACGTGFLTRHLHGDVTGLDQSETMLAAARAQAPSAGFVRGNALELPFEDGTFDRLFTSFFYGHLEPDDRERFVDEARRVARELIVVEGSRQHADVDDEWQERTLNDGSRWEVYKRYFTPDGLLAELGGGRVLHAGRWFVAVAA